MTISFSRVGRLESGVLGRDGESGARVFRHVESPGVWAPPPILHRRGCGAAARIPQSLPQPAG